MLDEDYPILIDDEALIDPFWSDQSVEDICNSYINPYLGKRSREEGNVHETA